MPPKADPRDWDRYFRPGAPRRGGPLRALANILLIGVTLGILGGAGLFAWSFGRERAQQSAATSVSMIETSNAGTIATQTARALATVTAQSVVAPSSIATPTATPEPILGRGSVTNGGNLRSEPVVAPETVVGQVCVGDQIDFLEQRALSDGAVWYRIRLTVAAADCTPQRVTVGSVGWASASLLSEITP
ncbi:SH3 domain-containing protein [Chloroflexales bacterium ZM16-3]|nr:SH3 domain-containing protein [Chloroflexales bacterium ZM16-3]